MRRLFRIARWLLVTTALLAPQARGQEKGTISGKVSDHRTGHALPFASVTVVGAQRGGLTDSEGQYSIGGVPAGTWEVRVQFLGYSPEAQAGVVVTGGRTTTLNFRLKEVVVRQEKVVEVTAERRLVEVKQGATVRSVTAGEIRNLPVQTIGEVLQQQAGINTENDQIHVRGGRADETIFVVNGVANRDLVTGQSTAGQLNARSVAEVNVATGAYDVRYGNALSGVVEVKLKEGGDRFNGGITTTNGTFGGRGFQLVAGGPDPAFGRLFRLLRLPGSVSGILDVSGSFYDTRFLSEPASNWFDGLFQGTFSRNGRGLRSSYEDTFLGRTFRYGSFFSPARDNRWSGRYGLTWKPSNRDKVTFNFSKRIAIDQGFSRTFINATGDLGDPSFPWIWARRIDHAPTIFEDNVQSSVEWRRSLSTTGFTTLQLSRYFFAQRQDVMGKMWWDYERPDDFGAFPAWDPRSSDFFLDTGDDDTWQDRRTTTNAVNWSLTQRFRRHEIEVGFDHEFQTVQYLTIQYPWDPDVDGLGSAHDLWRVHPWVGDFYVRDRLEYEGFTANVGLRGDYWFLGREVERAMNDLDNANISPDTRRGFFEDTRSFFGRRYKLHISPRVIVAHPITENSSFFFNYGEFTQNPSYRYVYSKLTSVSSESFPLLGNPNLNPQVSVNYEVGAKHQFLPTAAANLSFFVKDVYDYPTATTFKRDQGGSLVDLFVYLNGHFARSKGFEIELEKRRSHHWAGKLTYTYQQTKGKSSDPNEQKIVQAGQGDAAETRLSETYVRWNRPHKLAASLDVRFDNDPPAGLGWIRHTGFNLYLQGQSGRSYTPVNELGITTGEPNSENAPVQVTADFKVNRRIQFAGRRLDVALAGTNVFNNRLVNRVDPLTGRGRVPGAGSYDGSNPKLNVTNRLLVSQAYDPSNYGPGSQWRLTLDYDF
jgi:outer membrane receptor protein involved in Fe transport